MMENNQNIRNDEIEIDLFEVVGVLLAHWWVVIGSGVIFAVVAVIFTQFFITPQYRSVTKMYVLNRQNEDTLTNSDLQASSLLTKDYAELIKSRTVSEAVCNDMHLNLTPEELSDKISVSTPSDARVISIAVLDSDPEMARDLANEVRDKAAQHIQAVMNSEAVNVVDVANLPTSKYSPSLKKNGLMEGMVGLFLAGAIILLRYLLNDTIKTPEDVEKYLGLSTLGNIPVTKAAVRHKKTTKKTKMPKKKVKAQSARSKNA